MTGYWTMEGSDTELRDTDDIKELIYEMLDDGDDDGCFSEWLQNNYDGSIVDSFISNNGYCNDYFDELKEEFANDKAYEVLGYVGSDTDLFGQTLEWHEDADMVRVKLEVSGTIEYDANETTLEDFIKHNFPQDMSIKAYDEEGRELRLDQ